MLTRYSSSIFLVKALAWAAVNACMRHSTLHCSSILIAICKHGARHPREEQWVSADRLCSSKKREQHLVGRRLYAIAAQHLPKVLRAALDLVRAAVRQRVVLIRQLSVHGCQFVYLQNLLVALREAGGKCECLWPPIGGGRVSKWVTNLCKILGRHPGQVERLGCPHNEGEAQHQPQPQPGLCHRHQWPGRIVGPSMQIRPLPRLWPQCDAPLRATERSLTADAPQIVG